MGIYSLIKKEFSFLTILYGFQIYDRQKHGSYYYITWTNSTIKIKILFDCTDVNPVSILTYDADSLGTCYDVTRYQDELVTMTRKDREKIHDAAEWLKNAIADKTIQI